MTLPVTIGVDIGGTKIAVGAVDADGTVLRQLRERTPRSGSGAVLGVAERLIHQVSTGLHPRAIGVAAPGIIDPETGRVVSATDILPGWTGTPVRHEIATRLGLPVEVDNDVRVLARAEAHYHRLGRLATVLVVSVGTGVGGALLFNGQLRRGTHGVAGEIAHLQAGEQGPIPCGCGQLDHIEAVASGPAIQAAGSSDALEHAATVLGRALAGLANAIDLDAIILGGGVVHSGSGFVDPFIAALRQNCLPPLQHIAVGTSHLGNDAPIVGAALMAAALREDS